MTISPCDYLEHYDHGRLTLRFRITSRGRRECLVLEAGTGKELWRGMNKSDGLRFVAENTLIPWVIDAVLPVSNRLLMRRHYPHLERTLRTIYKAVDHGFTDWGHNHPAVTMFLGHEDFLHSWLRGVQKQPLMVKTQEPWWVDWDQYILACQSDLVGRDPKYYGTMFKGVKSGAPMVWPDPD